MSNYIYHNPHWGKSRKSVEILNNEGIKYTIIEYLKEPLSREKLIWIFNKLNIEPSQAIRKNEQDYKNNNMKDYLDDKNKIIDLMIKYPKIIERPIIIINNKVVIGRPPEKIYEII